MKHNMFGQIDYQFDILYEDDFVTLINEINPIPLDYETKTLKEKEDKNGGINNEEKILFDKNNFSDEKNNEFTNTKSDNNCRTFFKESNNLAFSEKQFETSSQNTQNPENETNIKKYPSNFIFHSENILPPLQSIKKTNSIKISDTVKICFDFSLS